MSNQNLNDLRRKSKGDIPKMSISNSIKKIEELEAIWQSVKLGDTQEKRDNRLQSRHNTLSSKNLLKSTILPQTKETPPKADNVTSSLAYLG